MAGIVTVSHVVIPIAVTAHGLAVSCLLTAVSSLLTTVSCLLTAVSCLLIAVPCLLIAVSSLLATIACRVVCVWLLPAVIHGSLTVRNRLPRRMLMRLVSGCIGKCCWRVFVIQDVWEVQEFILSALKPLLQCTHIIPMCRRVALPRFETETREGLLTLRFERPYYLASSYRPWRNLVQDILFYDTCCFRDAPLEHIPMDASLKTPSSDLASSSCKQSRISATSRVVSNLNRFFF